MGDVLIFLFPLNNYSGIFSSLILDMNLSERCDQSVSKVIGAWEAVTWIAWQELLLCTTLNNVSGNPHRIPDSQGSPSTHHFIIMLRATSFFPALDVLQCLWELRPRWVPDRKAWRFLVAQHLQTKLLFALISMLMDDSFFTDYFLLPLISWELSAVSVKTNTIQAFWYCPWTEERT